MIADNNQVLVAGHVAGPCTFSHRIYGEGFYRFDLSVERLSHAADLLPVTVSERLFDPQKLQEGVPVSVRGQLRTYNRYTAERSRLVLMVFARELVLCDALQGRQPNEVFLDGFLCKSPNFRTTPFGREICDLLLAVNRAYHKSDYVPCIAWGRNARFAGNLSVGDRLRVWGRMQSRAYQKQVEGGVEERMAYEVSVSKLEKTEND